MNENQYPSLDDQGKNLAKFTFDVLKNVLQGEPIFSSPEVVNERMEICKKCDKYDEKNNRCFECGCPLQHKTRFALDGCPLKKWNADESAWMNGTYEKYLT